MSKKTFLNSMLHLQQYKGDIFRADNVWKLPSLGGVVGGLLVSQALKAANSTVHSRYNVHSLHAYYLKPADVEKPLTYHVERLKDGATFVTRVIRAVQMGTAVFYMIVSYNNESLSELGFQYSMPDVPPPESLLPFDDLAKEFNTKNQWSINLGDFKPFDLRLIQPDRMKTRPNQKPEMPHNRFWIKLADYDDTNDSKQYQYVLAFLSDWGPFFSGFYPQPYIKVTFGVSLDHSVWFHKNFDPNQWLLMDCSCSRCENAQALIMGKMWSKDGVLVASFMQETIIRGSLIQHKL